MSPPTTQHKRAVLKAHGEHTDTLNDQQITDHYEKWEATLPGKTFTITKDAMQDLANLARTQHETTP